MSRRGDLQAALECRQPEGAVPLWELHFHCWEQFSGRHYVGRPEFDELTAVERQKALEANADVMVEVAEALCFAGVTIPDSPWDCFYTLPMDARLELARLLSRRSDADFVVVAACGGLLGMPDSEQYLEFSYKLFDAPEEIDELARQRYEAGIELAVQLRDSGVGAVYAGADLADNRGPWYSPEQMKRYILPYMHKWAQQIREMGMYAILHTDGDISPLLGDLVETGLHAIQAIDPVAGMDIGEVKRLVANKLCVCGNVDCGLLLMGTPQEVYDSTRNIILACKDGGGLALGASNAVVQETPLVNYREVIHAWRDYGGYRNVRTDLEFA